MKPKTFQNESGEVGYIWPSPEAIALGIEPVVPADCEEIPVKITQLPHQHAWAQKAWRYSNGAVSVDMTIATERAHELRRARRDKLYEPLDKLATSPIASVKNKAMSDKQAVYDADAVKQAAINAAASVEDLKAVLEGYDAL